MKTATIPSLRVTPELRAAAESLLAEGETLSGFVEQSIRESVERRQARQAFLARGLSAGEEARRTGEYYPAEQVHAELDELLDQAERRARP